MDEEMFPSWRSPDAVPQRQRPSRSSFEGEPELPADGTSTPHADVPPPAEFDAGVSWLRESDAAPASRASTPHASRREAHANRATEPARELPANWAADLTKDLTPPQKQAVLHTEGPLLVLAAAGSGKTRVITRRIAYLVSLGVPAWSILALTFTNKAAGEMRERVHSLLGDGQQSRGLTVTTFHALCARLLRRYAEQAGLKADYTIYDSGDQATLIKKAIEALQLSTSNFPPRSVLSAISNAKNQLMDASAYAQQALDFSGRHIARIYAAYEKGLQGANAVDFDDLLLRTAKLLRDNQAVRDEVRSRYQYILVDEYQDTNQAQFTIASMIAGGAVGVRERIRGAGQAQEESRARPNICVVGDPDQAIYGWRGADISNILDFEQSYPGCAVITLGENFRSTAPILKLADSLIRHNKRRKHKDLFTSKAGGERAEAVLCRDERHEASLIVDWLRHVREVGVDGKPIAWKDMAVFYRTNALSRVLEEAFRAAAVPYTIARGTAFYDREEIKNALSYLRVIANQSDGVSLLRIVNTPSRGISDATTDKLEELARSRSEPVLSTMRMFASGDGAIEASRLGLTGRALNSINAFVAMHAGWMSAGSFLGGETQGSLAELVDRVVKESGLEKMYRDQAAKSQSDADAQRLDNLAELISSARQFELEYDPSSDAVLGASEVREAPQQPTLLPLLRAYLESVSLVADADSVDPQTGSVTLMTLHAAKGLEFPAVAMVGMEESLLPHSRAVTSMSDAEMEEERRLCFVGITRAMRRLLMTSAKLRTMRGIPERTIPSRFLAEMDSSQLLISDQSGGLAGDLAGDGWDDEPSERGSRQLSGVRSDSGFSPSASKPAAAAAPGGATFRAGDKVRHAQFGLGTIRSASPGLNARVVIEFQEVGVKTLVLQHARLVKVGS
jgi:DNA helicase-2/ATP-dependent DNA helicase PcrA